MITKSGGKVEFRHSTRNTFRIRRKGWKKKKLQTMHVIVVEIALLFSQLHAEYRIRGRPEELCAKTHPFLSLSFLTFHKILHITWFNAAYIREQKNINNVLLLYNLYYFIYRSIKHLYSWINTEYNTIDWSTVVRGPYQILTLSGNREHKHIKNFLFYLWLKDLILL